MDLEALERRIGAQKSVREILSSMRSLAASQLRQGLHALEAQRAHERMLRRALSRLPRDVLPLFHPRRTLWVVWGTDQGLCGVYPRRLVEHARSVMRGDRTISSPVLVVGARTAATLKAYGLEVTKAQPSTGSLRGLEGVVQTIADDARELLASGACDGVCVIHVRHGEAPMGEPAVTRVHPIQPGALQQTGARAEIPVRSYEPLGRLAVKLQIEWSHSAFYRAALESFTAEQDARLRTTDAGTRHLDRHLEELRMEQHHLRKEAITGELMELMAGTLAVDRDR